MSRSTRYMTLACISVWAEWQKYCRKYDQKGWRLEHEARGTVARLGYTEIFRGYEIEKKPLKFR